MVRNIFRLLILLISFTACKTKKVDVSKSEKVSELKSAEIIDSLVKMNYKLIEEIRLRDVIERNSFALESVADSLHYERKVNGKVVEEIKLTGGKLLTKHERQEKAVNEVKESEAEMISDVESSSKKSEKTTTSEKNKQKNVEVKGGTFGTYASIIIIVIVLIVLAFLAWRLKLF